jgi:hypothetical protein
MRGFLIAHDSGRRPAAGRCVVRSRSHPREVAGYDPHMRPTRLLLSLPLMLACGSEGTAPAKDATPSFDVRRFAVRVVSFEPGEGAGFGQDRLPDVVLGPPRGKGPDAGGLDVLSLGQAGGIVLELGSTMTDGPGPDLLVFENAFRGPDGGLFKETAIVGASADGVTFIDWPCTTDDPAKVHAGCAGIHAVLSSPGNGIDPLDPLAAGGDAFDLADVGLVSARFVRVRDSGLNPSLAPSGGFDLDAVAVVHAEGLE